LARVPHSQAARKGLWPWLLAQLVVVAGWLPWLPIFLRQAFDPPVPPWRVPWTQPGEWLAAIAEALAAPLAGQSPPLGMAWPWATLVLLTLLAFVVYTKDARDLLSDSRWL